MRVVYYADDGTQFDNEWDCQDYEFKMNHLLDGIIFLDKDGNELIDPFSEDTYNKTEKVIVPSEELLKSLHELADYCGFCCYENIETVGTWVFKSGKFIKEE